MKKITRICFVITAIMLILNAVLSVSANEKLAENKSYSWYFVPVKNNEQPNFDVSLDDMKNYGAYALGSKDEKVIYLTFDFGYENGNVKKCLDALNKNNVNGTF